MSTVAHQALQRSISGQSARSQTSVGDTEYEQYSPEDFFLLHGIDVQRTCPGGEYEHIEEYGDSLPTLRPRHAPSGRDLDRERVVPPGPLDFVETNNFQLFVGGVIIVNMASAGYEMADPAAMEDCWWLDQGLLVFYCFELVMRLGHFKLQFFLDPADRCWNLSDLLIVLSGVLDQWVVAEIMPWRTRAGSQSYIGFARCARLLRVIKLFRVLMQADFVWTESPQFQTAVAAVISLNAAVMGIETDLVSPLWWWVEQAMLVFFVFELLVRLKREGFKFFYDEDDRWWNNLDFIIVVMGVMDLWVVRFVELIVAKQSGKEQEHSKGSTRFGQLMMLIRMLRLMRILRLLRLVKAVRPLYSLAMGVTQAMQSMFWVLVLLTMALYAFAILTTRLVGHELIVDGSSVPVRTLMMFHTVWDSTFTLFSIMNGQDWNTIEPLLQKVPWSKPIFVLFTVSSSWALLSVMTGVVSDHMMAVRTTQEKKDEETREVKREIMQRLLRGIFAAADKDGSGSLAREEYFELLDSPFHVRKVTRIANVPVQDLKMMFDWLDVDQSGEIDFNEFLHGFDWLNEPITGKSLLKLEHAVRSRSLMLREAIADLGHDMERLEDCYKTSNESMSKVLERTLDAKKALTKATRRAKDCKNEVRRTKEEIRQSKAANAKAAAEVAESQKSKQKLEVKKSPSDLCMLGRMSSGSEDEEV